MIVWLREGMMLRNVLPHSICTPSRAAILKAYRT